MLQLKNLHNECKQNNQSVNSPIYQNKPALPAAESNLGVASKKKSLKIQSRKAEASSAASPARQNKEQSRQPKRKGCEKNYFSYLL